MTANLFCFGLGFTGAFVARVVAARGGHVAGTVRDRADVAAQQRLTPVAGLRVCEFRDDHPVADIDRRLEDVESLLVTIPPGTDGDRVLRAHRDAIMRAPALTWVGYVSATSVYGDRGGALVNETATIAPSSARGTRRAAAEQAWLDLWHDHGLPVHIFRLAGIYGLGRSAIDQVRAGRARRLDKPGHCFSRIHVADVARAVIASMTHPCPGRIYNICDDHPAPSADVIAQACDLLGVTPPPLIPFADAYAEMSPMAREFWADDRRIDNQRMHGELITDLIYPSYREGLAAIAAGDDGSGRAQ